MPKERAKYRKKRSCVRRQNRRKNNETRKFAKAMAPTSSYTSSLLLPNQAEQQDQQRYQCGAQAPHQQIGVWKDDAIEHHEQVVDRETGKAEHAPEQQSITRAAIALQ